MASFSVGSKTVKKIRQGAALGTRETVAHARLRRQPVALQCRWLAKDKATSLGSDFSLGLPVDAPMEAYLSGGRMGHVMVVPGVQFDSVPPKGAHYLQLGQGAASQIISRARLQAAKPSRPDQQMAFGPDDATFVFPIFAERYTDPARFFAAVGELYHWIINVPPFDEQYVRDRFALLGYYWPTDPVVGQCNTRDKEYNCAKPPKQAVVFHGDNETAKAKFAHLMLDGRYGLVLIDSRVRGGAGGMADHGYPAWASTTACPRETWQGVALHEIGHALRLADEYVHPALDHQHWRGERNVVDSGDVDSAPWGQLFNEQPPSEASRFTREQQLSMRQGDLPADLAFVGMFAGARYRTDYYRPSLNCLMNATDCPQFCRVCAEEIRGTL